MVRGELPHTIHGVPLAASANGGQVQRLRCGLRSAIGKGGDPDYYRSDPLAASANGGDCSLGPKPNKKSCFGWKQIGSAGTKGKRKLGKHCRVMVHSVNGGQVGDIHNLQNELEQTVALQDSYIQAMSDETNMTKKQIQSLINKKVNVYLTAEEAIEKGLADEVLNG